MARILAFFRCWVCLPLGTPTCRLSDPDTSVTARTGDMGYNPGPNGLSVGCRVFYDVSDEVVEILAIVAKSEAESWLVQFGNLE